LFWYTLLCFVDMIILFVDFFLGFDRKGLILQKTILHSNQYLLLRIFNVVEIYLLSKINLFICKGAWEHGLKVYGWISNPQGTIV